MFLKSSAAIFFSIACLWGFDKDPPVIFQIRLLVQFCRAFTSIKYYACNICRHIWYINSPNYKWTAVHLQWNFREKALVLWKPSVVPLYKTTQTNFEVVDCDRALVFPLLWFAESASSKHVFQYRNTWPTICLKHPSRRPFSIDSLRPSITFSAALSLRLSCSLMFESRRLLQSWKLLFSSLYAQVKVVQMCKSANVHAMDISQNQISFC